MAAGVAAEGTATHWHAGVDHKRTSGFPKFKDLPANLKFESATAFKSSSPMLGFKFKLSS
jgi:hypothetical protein